CGRRKDRFPIRRSKLRWILDSNGSQRTRAYSGGRGTSVSGATLQATPKMVPIFIHRGNCNVGGKALRDFFEITTYRISLGSCTAEWELQPRLKICIAGYG